MNEKISFTEFDSFVTIKLKTKMIGMINKNVLIVIKVAHLQNSFITAFHKFFLKNLQTINIASNNITYQNAE